MRNQESNKDDSKENHIIRKRIVSGEYDLSDLIKIYLGKQKSTDFTSLTILHELTHRRLVNSTNYGLIQHILAFAQDNKKKINRSTNDNPPRWIKEASSLLLETIQKSTIAQEGYAVYCTAEFNLFYELDSQGTKLPDSYLEAYNYIIKLVDSIPIYLKPIESYIISGFLKIIFNTSILDDYPINSLDETLKSYISKPDNFPDLRLKRIISIFDGNSYDAKIIDEIKNGLTKLTSERGLEIREPIPESFQNLIVRGRQLVENKITDTNEGKPLASDEYIPSDDFRLGSELELLITGCLEREIHRKSPNFKISPETKSITKRKSYYENAQKYFSSYGVDLPDTISAKDMSPEELFIYDKTELLNENKYNETLLPLMETYGHLDRLLNSDYLFISELGILPNGKEISDHDTLYNISILPLKIIGQKAVSNEWNGIITQPTLEKVTFWGSWEFMNKIINDTLNTTLCFINEISLIDFESWEIADPIIVELYHNTGKQNVTIIPFTQGLRVHKFLEKIKESGVKLIFPFQFEDEFTSYLFLLESGMQIILKLTTVLYRTYRKRMPEIYNWIRSLLPPPEYLLSEKCELSLTEITCIISVLEIEKLGGFRNPYNPPQLKFVTGNSV